MSSAPKLFTHLPAQWPVRKITKDKPKYERLTPKRILAHLDSVVIGQKEAKRALVGAAYIHMLRTGKHLRKSMEGEVNETSWNIHKTNVLVTGPTGVGKTLMLRTLSEHLGVPFFEIDATKLTPEGYKGRSLNDEMTQFVKQSKSNMINYSVILIDEVDKIGLGKDTSSSGNWASSIQSSILKLIEGCRIADTEFDTYNMMFVLGGNFEALRKAREEVKNPMGFAGTPEKPKEMDRHAEIIKAGIVPELAGRIAVISELTNLSKEEFERVITESKASPYSNYLEILDSVGIDGKLNKKQIGEIVDKAMRTETGLRGLATILAEYYIPIIMEHDYE